MPLTWFHEELEKKFNKIQTLLDQNLNILTDSGEKPISDNVATKTPTWGHGPQSCGAELASVKASS